MSQNRAALGVFEQAGNRDDQADLRSGLWETAVANRGVVVMGKQGPLAH